MKLQGIQFIFAAAILLLTKALYALNLNSYLLLGGLNCALHNTTVR